jgi:hypothetical protein
MGDLGNPHYNTAEEPGDWQEDTRMKTETFDITPEGYKTVEGINRVLEAKKQWDDAAFALANASIEFFDTHEDLILSSTDGDLRDDLHQIRALIGGLRRKQEAFLYAVAGQTKP